MKATFKISKKNAIHIPNQTKHTPSCKIRDTKHQKPKPEQKFIYKPQISTINGYEHRKFKILFDEIENLVLLILDYCKIREFHCYGCLVL